MGDDGHTRAFLQPFGELVEGMRRPTGKYFHGAVGHIPGITCDAQWHSLLPGRFTKPHPLHTALDAKPATLHQGPPCTMMNSSIAAPETGPTNVFTGTPAGSRMMVVGKARGAPKGCGGSSTSTSRIG